MTTTDEAQKNAQTDGESEDKKKSEPTTYVVLAAATKEGPFLPVGIYTGSEQFALKQAEESPTGKGDFDAWVAVPQRSWRVRKPETTTKTETKFV